MVNILVIPDAHATPYHNNDRFELLGKFIADRRPDVVLSIGDFADMPSLSSYDKGKKSFEGRRYYKDIDSVIDAQNRMFKPIEDYNNDLRKRKVKLYKPHYIITLGNHCERINRAANLSPELDGTLKISDLQYEKFGWDVIPFLEPVMINGVAFSHYFPRGVMGRAISGENPALALINKLHTSCVQGHSHIRDFSERTTVEGKRLQGLVVGCFLDEDQHEAYAGEANKMWWRGVVMLHDVDEGSFEPEFISVKQLRRMYEKS